MYLRLLWIALIFMSCNCRFAAASDGYPSANDTCEAFSSKFFKKLKSSHTVDRGFLKHDPQLLELDLTYKKVNQTMRRDISEFAYIDERFQVETEQAKNSATAADLLVFCAQNESQRLSDIAPLDLVRFAWGGPDSPLSQLHEAAVWYKSVIGKCGVDTQCINVANSYKQHAVACYKKDKQACAAIQQDGQAWAQLNAGTAQVTSNNPAMDKWVADSLAVCGANADCATVVRSYQAHANICASGNRQACIDRDRDLKDWNSFTSTRSVTAQGGSSDAMMQCLQQAGRQAVEGCNRSGCQTRDVPELVRFMQQAQCGYSAIEPQKQITLPSPQFPTNTNCTSTPRVGGGSDTNCTQY